MKKLASFTFGAAFGALLVTGWKNKEKVVAVGKRAIDYGKEKISGLMNQSSEEAAETTQEVETTAEETK